MAFDNKGYDHNLQIINQNKNEILGTIKVKIATSKDDRSKGLMFVRNLPLSYGMLFDFKNERIINMWMKNTLIPLDIIFIDKNDIIIRIVSPTAPLSMKIISSEYPAVKVLELNAGVAKSLKIDIGNRIALVN